VLKRLWTQPELDWLVAHPHADHREFTAAGFDRTYHAFRMKRYEFNFGRTPADQLPVITDNRVETETTWREWNGAVRQMQALRKKARGSLEGEAEIFIESDQPVAFVVLGDTHIGAWSADHELFERITDEILSIPNLYIALMGDLAAMSVKLRGVAEVTDNILPPQEQLLYLASWLEEVQHRVIFTTWGNHEIERAENQLGISPFADLYRRTCRHYFGTIGHLSIQVNEQVYPIAASHHFMGRSIYSPVHGIQRYLTLGPGGEDRLIGIAGDSHVPGIMKFTHGAATKLAVNCGSSQTMSSYAQRYFSLTTHPVFPVVVLNHKEHGFYAHWNLAEYLSASGAA